MIRDGALYEGDLLKEKVAAWSRPVSAEGVWEQLRSAMDSPRRVIRRGTETICIGGHCILLEAHGSSAGDDYVRCARPEKCAARRHHYQYAAAGFGFAERYDLR